MINTTGWDAWRSGVARYDGTLVSPSPLVNVSDSSRTVMTDLPPPLTKMPGRAQTALLLLLFEGGALARGLPAIPLAHGSLLSLSLGSHISAIPASVLALRHERRALSSIPLQTP